MVFLGRDFGGLSADFLGAFGDCGFERLGLSLQRFRFAPSFFAMLL